MIDRGGRAEQAVAARRLDSFVLIHLAKDQVWMLLARRG